MGNRLRVLGMDSWFMCKRFFWSEVKWSEVKCVTVKFLRTNVPCTLWWPYIEGTGLYCDYFMWCVFCAVGWFCNVWVCVCVGFMCGCVYVLVLLCVGVLVICVCLYLLCFVLFVLWFCVVWFMYIICFVCTSVRTTATEWKLNCSINDDDDNDDNNNNNNNYLQIFQNKTRHCKRLARRAINQQDNMKILQRKASYFKEIAVAKCVARRG